MCYRYATKGNCFTASHSGSQFLSLAAGLHFAGREQSAGAKAASNAKALLRNDPLRSTLRFV